MLPVRWIVCAFILFVVSTAFTHAQTKLSPAERKQISEFEKRANAYIKLREKVKTAAPPLKKDATAAELEAYKDGLQKAVIAARSNAVQGQIFTPQVSPLIKRLIKTSLVDFEKSEVRKTVLEADTKGVPIKVNAVYPESKELVEMPPPLLLALPQLPKDLRWRFIGRSLALVDRDGSLIIDYLPNALP